MRRIIAILLLILSCNTYALQQNAKAWLDINISDDLFANSKIKYLLDAEIRFLNHSEYYETTRAQTGLGYQLWQNFVVWGGYQWITSNDYTNSSPETRIWEQAVWDIVHNNEFKITSRTRLEQRNRIEQAEMAQRLRERLTLKLPNKLFNYYTPVFYDELFFNLNKPIWVSNKTFSENRIFIGIDLPSKGKAFWEIGYLNQYEFNSIENQMGHILYVSYNM